MEAIRELIWRQTLLFADWNYSIDGTDGVEWVGKVFFVGTIFVSIVIFLFFLEDAWILFDIPPFLLIIVLELSMLQLSLRLPQFFLLRWFVKLVLGAYIRQLWILLLIFVLKVLQDGVYIVALVQTRFVGLDDIYLLENVGLHGIMFACLLEFLLCRPEDV